MNGHSMIPCSNRGNEIGQRKTRGVSHAVYRCHAFGSGCTVEDYGTIGPSGPMPVCSETCPKRAEPLVQLSQKNGAVAVAEGVGTEVSLILKSIGASAEVCDQCADMIRWMNEIGVASCSLPENRETILKRLREQAAKAGWWNKRKAEALAVSTGLFTEVSWSDPAPGILDKAIRLVTEREKSSGK